MPSDYEASRRRDARFMRRLLFTVATFWLMLHVAAAAAYTTAGNPLPLCVLGILDGAAVGIGGAAWLSGKIFR